MITSNAVTVAGQLEQLKTQFPEEFAKAWRSVGPRIKSTILKALRTGKAGNVSWKPLHPYTEAMRSASVGKIKRGSLGSKKGNGFGGRLRELIKYDTTPQSVEIGVRWESGRKAAEGFQTSLNSSLPPKRRSLLHMDLYYVRKRISTARTRGIDYSVAEQGISKLLSDGSKRRPARPFIEPIANDTSEQSAVLKIVSDRIKKLLEKKSKAVKA